MDELTIELTSEYQQSTITDNTDITMGISHGDPDEMNRIVLMLYNSNNTIRTLTWASSIIWSDADVPLYIGNSNSTSELIKIEFWKTINNQWSCSYVRYTESGILEPQIGSPYDVVLATGNQTNITLNDTDEYQNHTISSGLGPINLSINIPVPNSDIDKANRIFFTITDTNTDIHGISWLGTTIIWENDDNPQTIGSTLNPFEILSVTLWENPLNSNTWIGSYTLHTPNAAIIPVPTLSIPYDISFSISSDIQANSILGSFAITRDIDLEINAPGSIVYVENVATNGSYTLLLNIKSNNGTITTNVGSITFSLNQRTGVLLIPNQLSLTSGDVLQLSSDGSAIDPGLKDISITLVGCSTTIQC